MKKQFRKDYKDTNIKEEKRSFKYQGYPQRQEYYSSKISYGQKGGKFNDLYNESSPNSRNFKTDMEFNKYNSEYTPYNQRNKNFSQNNIFMKKEFYSTNQSDNYNSNYNSNDSGYYSTYKKTMVFGNTDLRNEYSPIAEARVNIRKKLLEEKIASRTGGNYNNINELLENFQYHESNNIRNKSEQKYDSITRVVGYSNIIPLQNQRMIYNYSNVDINKNGNYNKKIEHNYIQRKEVTNIQQKKEFKKPAQLETAKKTEIIKKYEITKKPEIKKEVENKYKKYEKKKEETIKKEVKKTEVKKENTSKKIEIKKEVKEPKIIKRKENIKAVFSSHSGRYQYKNNIANEIATQRKNYNQNSLEKNVKKVEIVQKSSKSEKKVDNKVKAKTETKAISVKKEIPKTEIKKTEVLKKETKVVSNIKPVVNKQNITSIKKINVTENVSNYMKNKEQNINKVNDMAMKNRNITVKTESYGKINDIYRQDNLDIGQIINIKEINRIYEMKRKNRNNTPKMKTRRINLGDNYKYYERKYMQSPDENYYTLHQRRNQRVIYGEQIIESNGVIKKIRMYKSKPFMTDERYNSQIINNYKNNYNMENRRRIYNDEDGEYYYESAYSYH